MAGPTWLTTVRRTVAADVVGYPVCVASGRGARQVRVVVKVEGDRVFVDRPWMVTPGVGSVVQFGGFAWEWKSGWFRFADDEEGNPRDVEVVFGPTKRPSSFDVNLYLGHSDDPRPWAGDSDEGGVVTRAGDPNLTVDMRGDGYFNLRGEGHADAYLNSEIFLSVGLAGCGSGQVQRFYQVILTGVTP